MGKHVLISGSPVGKSIEYRSDGEASRRADSILYRFRLLFYTGCAVSVLLVQVLGVISYTSLSQQQVSASLAGHSAPSLGRIKVMVASGTVLVLVIVAFLVYIVLNELNSRFRAYQKEHELNELKSNFVTLASHEFRTPLSSVLLSAALIEKYAKKLETENVVKHCLKIKHVVQRLERILEDFLSLEKLDARQVKAAYSNFHLAALCKDLIVEARLGARAGQQIHYEQAGNSGMVRLDERLIRNVLTHLLFNAIKYAGDNVCIRLITQIRDGKILISVKDNGTGIAEKDQEKLFSIFYRIGDSGNIPGTGLGLHLVHRYVQIMDGTLRFYSKPNEETCFELEFPARH
jgi:signal transduction histidine kinase